MIIKDVIKILEGNNATFDEVKIDFKKIYINAHDGFDNPFKLDDIPEDITVERVRFKLNHSISKLVILSPIFIVPIEDEIRIKKRSIMNNINSLQKELSQLDYPPKIIKELQEGHEERFMLEKR